MEVLGNVRHDGPLIGLLRVAQVFDVEKLGNVKVLLSDIEGQLRAAMSIGLVESIVIEQVRSMPVNKSAESQARLPRVRKVYDVNLLVWRCLALTPEQQTLLCVHTFLTVRREDFRRRRTHLTGPFFLPDVGNRESQDESPNHAQDEFQVAVHDVCGSGAQL